MTRVEKNIRTILFCPLDWGLGHASRDIYLIRKLLDTGKYKIIIGADNAPYHLLKAEFPGLEFIRLPSFNISYSNTIPFVLKIALQIPAILIWKNREHKLLQKLIDSLKIDMLISDNRYGLWNKNIPSVIISHQLNILLPRKTKLINKFINKKIKQWLNRFDQCWVPDYKGKSSLAGILSNGPDSPASTMYIGPVSRFLLKEARSERPPSKNYEVLAILSGPEPQRSKLEKIIIRKFRNKDISVLIVRGIPWQKQGQVIYNNISLVSHLESRLLYSYINNAKYIICRAGYTTIMDLSVLGKTAILIPTPGQTEQEYLAKYHFNKKHFYMLEQSNPDFEKAFSEISAYRPIFKKSPNSFLDSDIFKE